MSDLPEGWARVALGDIAEVRLGRQRSPKNHTGPNMRPYLRAANVTWRGVDLTDVKEMHFTPTEVETYRLEVGDVVLSEASGSPGEVGKSGLWSGAIPDCCIQNTLIRVRGRGATDPAFIDHRLRFEALMGIWSRDVARGVGIFHLGSTRLASWTLNLPPIAEQVRIAAELDRRLARIEVAVAGLKSSIQLVHAAQASVRHAAVTGRLGTKAGGGSLYQDLHEEILQRREEAGPRALLLSDDRPSHSAGWDVRLLGELAWDWGYGTSAKCGYDNPGPAVVRIPNVVDGRVVLNDVKRAPTAGEVAGLELDAGDALFVRSNGSRDLIGRAAVIHNQMDAAFASYIIRFRLPPDPLLGRWVALVAGSPDARRHLVGRGSSSAGQYNLSLGDIGELPIPLPSRSIAEMVLDEAERRLSLLAAARRTIEVALARADQLRRSILNEAFCGRLVPQDPSDEPMTTLLERLKNENGSQTKFPQRNKKAEAK